MSDQLRDQGQNFVVKQWDDFHDDGSEDGACLGTFTSLEEAEQYLFAIARAYLADANWGGDIMVSWTINHKVYRYKDHPAMAQPLTKADRTLLKR